MQRKLFLIAMVAFLSIVFLGLGYLSYAQEANVDNDPHATGLIPMTPEEEEFFVKTHPKIIKVLANRLGLQRINAGRRAKGLAPLSEEGVTDIQGQDIISVIHGKAPSKTSAKGVVSASLLPLSVDNSLLPAFPPIRSQGNLGSCTTFASTYYQMTHMAGLMYGWDNKNEVNTTKFSPRWTYNFVNNGVNKGSSFPENYNVLQGHGAATWAEFPYDGVDYKQWCLDTSAWQNAINYRMQPAFYIADVDTSAGLDQVKEILTNGSVVIYGTYISSWQWTSIKDDPSTPLDDAFVGKHIAYWVNGIYGGHAMTIVGYNDAIWTDINKNRVVDPGEKGALRIANSWGTGWEENGFTWLAYDALKAVSAVSGAPYRGRIAAFMGNRVFVTVLKDHYSPKMLAEFTVNHAKRNQLIMNLGISETPGVSPVIKWYPAMFCLRGGAYAFDGSQIAGDGTFAFDFTDILTPGDTQKTYYLGMFDSATGNSAALSSLILKDKINNQEYAVVNLPGLPHYVDAGQDYASIDYAFSPLSAGITNNPPLAVVQASPLSGLAPLTVNFDGQQSSDSDGTISDYCWNFGYEGGGGTIGSTPQTSYTYDYPGVFSTKLTVTDNLGAQSSNNVVITVETDPSKTVHISNISMSIQTGKTKYAKATVTIVNSLGSVVSGATVYGHWSGLTTDTDSGATKGTGQVTLSSDSVSKTAAGTFSFCVDDVVLTGGAYDAALNVETCDSITTP